MGFVQQSRADRFQRATPESVLLVVSLEPYAASVSAIARDAQERGIAIVAITDSLASPVGRMASITIPVEKSSVSFFDTITPAFVVGELLVALLAAHVGPDITSRIKATEMHLRRAGVY